MSRTRRWITLLLAIIAVVLIGWNLTNQESSSPAVVADDQSPTYTTASTHTVVYNPEGGLAYTLDSAKVAYFDTARVSWFDNPVMTTFDPQKAPAWSVKADKAKLTQNRMLYLYGHVEVRALSPNAKIERMTTDNAQVNLVTQDVTSDDQVTLYGQDFHSTGMKMRGNLRAKTAELIEKVKTYYEIQNQH